MERFAGPPVDAQRDFRAAFAAHFYSKRHRLRRGHTDCRLLALRARFCDKKRDEDRKEKDRAREHG